MTPLRPTGHGLGEACSEAPIRLAAVQSQADSIRGENTTGGAKTGAREPHVGVHHESSAGETSDFFSTPKTCSKCELPKPRTVEFFPSDARKRDGLRAECRECFSAPRRERYWRMREQMLAQAATWRAANPDYDPKSAKPYIVEDREHVRAVERANPARVAMERMRKRLQKIIGKSGIRTIGFIGCSSAHLRQHLEAQFLPGMSWDNRPDWHIDHIRPLSSFDLSDPEQFKAASHYTNLQPLWAIDNLRKGASMPEGLAA